MTGRLQRSPEGIIHVIADRLDDRSAMMARIAEASPTGDQAFAAQPRASPPGADLSPLPGLPLTENRTDL